MQAGSVRRLLLLLALALATLPARAATDPATVEREEYIKRALAAHPLPATVAGRRLTGAGSGVYVTPNQVVTNDHVVAACTAITSRLDGGDWAPARVLAREPGTDLAVIASDLPSPHPAPVPPPAPGTDANHLAVVGYPELGRLAIRPILLPATARVAEITADAAVFRLHADLHHGNSGSPVLDPAGSIVGIVSKKVDSVAVYRASGRVIEDLGLAVSAGTVRRFLDAHQVAYRGTSGAPLAPAALLDAARQFVAQIGCWN